MKSFTTRVLPQNCWIFSKGRYILTNKSIPELPYVDLEYENILKSNGIPYRKTTRIFDRILNSEPKEVCEYWNPETRLEEEEFTFPLYAKMPDGSYMYCQKNYSGKVPTNETIEAALKTRRFVEQEVDNYNQILREVHHYQFAKEKLADSVAVVCFSDDTPFLSIYEINMNYDRFIILRPYTGFYLSSWVAIFNMNKIAPNGYLTLQVPKHIAGAIIGEGGSNIRAWSEEIGVKRIQVVPI